MYFDFIKASIPSCASANYATWANIGAGRGNRTPVASLENWCSTIELHPRECKARHRTTSPESVCRSLHEMVPCAGVGPAMGASHMIYSHAPIRTGLARQFWSSHQDSNLSSPAPEAGVLARLHYDSRRSEEGTGIEPDALRRQPASNRCPALAGITFHGGECKIRTCGPLLQDRLISNEAP